MNLLSEALGSTNNTAYADYQGRISKSLDEMLKKIETETDLTACTHWLQDQERSLKPSLEHFKQTIMSLLTTSTDRLSVALPEKLLVFASFSSSNSTNSLESVTLAYKDIFALQRESQGNYIKVLQGPLDVIRSYIIKVTYQFTSLMEEMEKIRTGRRITPISSHLKEILGSIGHLQVTILEKLEVVNSLQQEFSEKAFSSMNIKLSKSDEKQFGEITRLFRNLIEVSMRARWDGLGSFLKISLKAEQENNSLLIQALETEIKTFYSNRTVHSISNPDGCGMGEASSERFNKEVSMLVLVGLVQGMRFQIQIPPTYF